MAHRVRSRGRIGPKASATLRAVFPLVLGLGGWFLGLLVVLTIMPSVPLDSALLATLSIGLPVGLGVYLAWVRRDRSASIRGKGFVVAVAGALVGAWLGFNATAGMLALITAIVGAGVGANLPLIVLDIVDARRGDRSPQPVSVVQIPERVEV